MAQAILGDLDPFPEGGWYFSLDLWGHGRVVVVFLVVAGFWVMPGSDQSLLLVLCSEIISGAVWNHRWHHARERAVMWSLARPCTLPALMPL